MMIIIKSRSVKVFWILAACVLMGGVQYAPAQQQEKPNFLIILADDLGFSDVGSYGGEIDTPHLDRLAEHGLRYTQMYSEGRCWPSRGAILTGYYAEQVRLDPPKRQFDGLPEWGPTLPAYLKPLGYRTYHSGKWHIVHAPSVVKSGGFDRSYRLNDFNRYFAPNDHRLDGEPLPEVDRSDDYYATAAIARHMNSFLRQHEQEHADRPFVSYLAFTAPHFPLHAPQDTIEKYDGVYDAGWDKIRRQRLNRLKQMGLVDRDMPLPPREPNVHRSHDVENLKEVFGPGEVSRAVAWSSLTDRQKVFQAQKMQIHAAMVDEMDQAIGRVLKQLKAMDERANTVVMFMSDNGACSKIWNRGDKHDQDVPLGSPGSYPCLGPGWSTASNTPYRLHKQWMHHGGTASPFIVNWPDGLSEQVHGEFRRTPALFIDLLPTMLELAGHTPRPAKENGPELPGRSLVPTFRKDRRIQRPYLYWRHSGNRALRIDDWRVVYRKGRGKWELYDLRKDLNELNDLARERPELRKKMMEKWTELSQKFDRQSGLSD